MPIVFVRHDSGKEDSPVHRGHPGNALIDAVAAAPADLFITKTVNSAFFGTADQGRWLRAEGAEQLVVCGVQMNMCGETTARMGGNLGFGVIVPIDATRTFELAARTETSHRPPPSCGRPPPIFTAAGSPASPRPTSPSRNYSAGQR